MHLPSASPRPSIYYNYQVFKPWLPTENGTQEKKKVVIVGAGPAGMVSALELARHGVASVVLASDLQFSRLKGHCVHTPLHGNFATSGCGPSHH